MAENKSKVKTTQPQKNQKATKVALKDSKVVKAISAKPGLLSVPVLSLVGRSNETLSLPKEFFGQEINQALLVQALRVYSNNLKTHWGNTKTRGEVSMTTAKVYRQKGTGNARHGAKSAPIFVHGGVALGPKYRKVKMELPKKMKKGALIAALSTKAQEGEVLGLTHVDKSSGKTKEFANLLKNLAKKSALVVTDKPNDHLERAVRNLEQVNFLTADKLNAFEVIRHQSLLLTKEAVDRLQGKMPKEEKQVQVVPEKITKPQARLTTRKAVK